MTTQTSAPATATSSTAPAAPAQTPASTSTDTAPNSQAAAYVAKTTPKAAPKAAPKTAPKPPVAKAAVKAPVAKELDLTDLGTIGSVTHSLNVVIHASPLPSGVEVFDDPLLRQHSTTRQPGILRFLLGALVDTIKATSNRNVILVGDPSTTANSIVSTYSNMHARIAGRIVDRVVSQFAPEVSTPVTEEDILAAAASPAESKAEDVATRIMDHTGLNVSVATMLVDQDSTLPGLHTTWTVNINWSALLTTANPEKALMRLQQRCREYAAAIGSVVNVVIALPLQALADPSSVALQTVLHDQPLAASGTNSSVAASMTQDPSLEDVIAHLESAVPGLAFVQTFGLPEAAGTVPTESDDVEADEEEEEDAKSEAPAKKAKPTRAELRARLAARRAAK